jgi:DNA-binding winged helix-turn-helix (wHTH) protein/TolB-like protein/Tfp pilus assembly protein PilF
VSHPPIETYEFGPYRIDAAQRLLHRNGELIPLPPKVASTLLVLLGDAGRLVDKNDLMKAVWPDTFVEEGALTRNISLLRKALGDTADPALFIETIPRRGYRFIAPVRTLARAPAGAAAESPRTACPEPANGRPSGATDLPPSSTRSLARWLGLAAILVLGLGAAGSFVFRKLDLPPPAPLVARGSALAVLRLRSVDPDPAQAYFADGITQALVTRLANVRNLRLVSFISGGEKENTAWAEVQRNPSIRRVLTGTVLRSGGRVRVDLHVLDPVSRAVVWARTFDRELTQVLALESAVAEAIAGEIQVNLSTEDLARLHQRRQASPEALDACLRGRYFWNRRTEEGLKRAVQYFQEAIAADPAYAPAYAGLADSYSLLGSVGTDSLPPRQAMPLAKAAAQKAIELDPDLAEGHASLAYVMLSYDWDLPGAAREFARALELNPASATARHWYSHYFMAAGDLAQASVQMREALQLEPLSPSINIGIGWCLYYSKQYDQAIAQFRSVTEIDPTLPMAHLTLGMAFQQKGQLDQAIESYRRAAANSGNSPASVTALAGAYAALGRREEARAQLARLQEMSRHRYVPAFYFSSVHYALGDLAATFAWGRKAFAERCDYLLYLGVEPRVGRLAGNPAYIRLMAFFRR